MRAMRGATVLVVEDDAAIRDSLVVALTTEGYAVIPLEDGRGIERHLGTADLAILDVDLPAGPDGYELTRRIRRHTDLPVIILTAAGALDHKGTGYRAGADQYVVKPFLMTELLWQIAALLKRAGRTSETLQAGPFTLEPDGHSARCAGHELQLTPLEFSLLHMLVLQAGRTLSKVQLLALVWGHTDHDPNLVETCIRRLRAKVAPHGGDAHIETVRGFGYRLRR